MPKKNPYKQTAELPAWALNLLKVVLIGVFLWQFSTNIPEDYWIDKEATNNKISIEVVETIEYSQLLGTTTPFPTHYLKWADETIYYLEPSQEFSAPFYEVSQAKIKQLANAKWNLFYKGQQLDIIDVHAVFLLADGLPIFCEGTGKECLQTQLDQLEEDFELWLSLDTREHKRFFTKIRVGSSIIHNNPAIEKANIFWEKLIDKEKFKAIDDLTVAKPVFQNNTYVFKWGDWERHVDRSLSEPRIKIDTATFKNLLRYHAPGLYKDDQYVPFRFSVGFWDRKRWDMNCYISRKNPTPSILDTYYCLDRLIEESTVGDYISLFIYEREEISNEYTGNEFTNGIPPFVLNGRRVRLYIALELVGEPIDQWDRPLELATSSFGFQLHNGLQEGPIVKMDTLEIKNQTLFDHYNTSGSAKVVHIPNFKTIRRVYNPEDNFIASSEIDHTHILVDTLYAVHTFPEFYDFNILPPIIKSRGLSMVLDKTCYWLDDYINYRNPFEILLGQEKVKLLQTNITVVPKDGDIIRYITDNPDRYDINSHLDRLPPQTSIYFDDILFERTSGEQLAFPLAVALHLK